MRRCNLWQNLAMTLLPAQLLTLLPFGAWFVMQGWVSGADLLMLVILSLGLITPFIIISGYMDDMAKMGTIIGEATSILEKPELSRPAVISERPKGSTIELKNVRFGYKDEEILHGIDLKIKEGNVTALVGPSGAGKSTVAKLIASFWDVNGGEIDYGGVDIRKIPLDEYNRNIAYILPQHAPGLGNTLESIFEKFNLGRPEDFKGHSLSVILI